ncbi:MAG: pyridoxal-dependent decarboxylase, partial [Hyphomonadaceae bacterium]
MDAAPPKDHNTSIEALGRLVLEALHDYRITSEAGTGPVLVQKPAAELAEELGLEAWLREGGLDAANVEDFLTPYLENTQHMHHPGYIGHQVAVPHAGSSLADMVHGAINNPMAIYEMGPAASVIERVVLNWMLGKVSWFKGSGVTDFAPHEVNGAGVLTHGGSLANLTAVLAARAAFAPEAWEEGVPPDFAIIVPKAAHYSMARAVSIAGMGQNAICPAPVTDMDVLRPEALETVYTQATERGRKVFMVSANACATSTGLYDPVDEIADFCETRGLWLHIDGAHGASALLSDDTKHLMKGVARADSLIWDAHKMMRTSALVAAVLFKDQKHLSGAFQQDGSYIFHDKNQPGFDLAPYTVECTKAALGTKLFWVLAMEGEQGLGDFVARQYADTRTF